MPVCINRNLGNMHSNGFQAAHERCKEYTVGLHLNIAIDELRYSSGLKTLAKVSGGALTFHLLG